MPYVNIALDAFALTVTLIILAACFKGFSSKNLGSKHFVFLLCATIVALISNMIVWIGKVLPSLSVITLISNTVAVSAYQIAIICFMGYLIARLYPNNRTAKFVLNIFRVLCVVSLIIFIVNAFFGYSFLIDEQGHYIRSADRVMGFVYLIFHILSFFAIILLALFAKSSAKINRVAFIIYIFFPTFGIIVDYIFHESSFAYMGLTVSILTIYTSIYLKAQKQLEAQQNALMLSQINPHFIYNTLSTIASMCDVSPNQAKNLTIDFSRYLRQNLSKVSPDETVPFEQELNHIECYLKIEKARFRERLNIIYNVQCKDFSIPPLSVQPLVENAVKHGITKKAEGGTVKICTYDNVGSYFIEIIDDGVGFDTENVEMHVGLKNVQGRIASLCKGNVTVKSTIGVGTRVTIEIPKKKVKRK